MGQRLEKNWVARNRGLRRDKVHSQTMPPWHRLPKSGDIPGALGLTSQRRRPPHTGTGTRRQTEMSRPLADARPRAGPSTPPSLGARACSESCRWPRRVARRSVCYVGVVSGAGRLRIRCARPDTGHEIKRPTVDGLTSRRRGTMCVNIPRIFLHKGRQDAREKGRRKRDGGLGAGPFFFEIGSNYHTCRYILSCHAAASTRPGRLICALRTVKRCRRPATRFTWPHHPLGGQRIPLEPS